MKNTVEPYQFADIFNFSIFLVSIDRFRDWLSILLSTCMTIFPYDLCPKLIARAYSTGTTLFLTPKCLLAYIKRTMYKRSNTPIASFSSGSEIFASYPEIVRKYKDNRSIQFLRSREKLQTGRGLRNYTYVYATLSSEFHNHLWDVHNSIFTMIVKGFGYWNFETSIINTIEIDRSVQSMVSFIVNLHFI